MLTKLTVRNFKRFEEVEIELGNPVVFVGPNNSGKTTAMQALALWDVGLKQWLAKRSGRTAPEGAVKVRIGEGCTAEVLRDLWSGWTGCARRLRKSLQP